MFESNQNNVYGNWNFSGNPSDIAKYQAKRGSSLSDAEYEKLLTSDSPFTLQLTETEVLRGICNHQSKDGTRDMLVNDADGYVRCQVCGYKFMPVDPNLSIEDVKHCTDTVIDILQSIKLLFIDMPVATQREFYQIIPLIGKIPDLFDLAIKNFAKHENINTWNYKSGNMSTMNMFNMLSNVLGGANIPQQSAGASYSAMGNPAFNMPNVGANPYGTTPSYGAFGAPLGAQPMNTNMGAPVMGAGTDPKIMAQLQAMQDEINRLKGQSDGGYTAKTKDYAYSATDGSKPAVEGTGASTFKA